MAVSQLLVITGAIFFVSGLLAEMINNLQRQATGHHRIAEVRRIERRSLTGAADVHFERRSSGVAAVPGEVPEAPAAERR